MSRADEIAQGLRDETGALIGGLDILECFKAAEDFAAGRPPPRMTTTSYDVWRARLGREADERRQVRAAIDAESARSRAAVREILTEQGRADLLAEFDAKMAELDRAHYARTAGTER